MTIYFVRLENDGPIKIGYTSGDAKSRMAQLQTGQPQILELLGTIPGERDAEQGLHEEFKEYRTNGEWFKPNGRLLLAIKFLIDTQSPWFLCRQFTRTHKKMEGEWYRAFSATQELDQSSFIALSLPSLEILNDVSVVQEGLNKAVRMRKLKGRFPSWGTGFQRQLDQIKILKAHLYWNEL